MENARSKTKSETEYTVIEVTVDSVVRFGSAVFEESEDAGVAPLPATTGLVVVVLALPAGESTSGGDPLSLRRHQNVRFQRTNASISLLHYCA